MSLAKCQIGEALVDCSGDRSRHDVLGNIPGRWIVETPNGDPNSTMAMVQTHQIAEAPDVQYPADC